MGWGNPYPQIVDAWAHVGIHFMSRAPNRVPRGFLSQSDCELFPIHVKMVLRRYICVIIGLVYLNHCIFHRQALATHHRDLNCWLWHLLSKPVFPKLSGPRDQFRVRQSFHGPGKWFQDDSRTLYLLCALFLLLLHQLHLRSLGIRSEIGGWGWGLLI